MNATPVALLTMTQRSSTQSQDSSVSARGLRFAGEGTGDAGEFRHGNEGTASPTNPLAVLPPPHVSAGTNLYVIHQRRITGAHNASPTTPTPPPANHPKPRDGLTTRCVHHPSSRFCDTHLALANSGRATLQPSPATPATPAPPFISPYQGPNADPRDPLLPR
ncbi:unnamed protein product [Lampetra planeri]